MSSGDKQHTSRRDVAMGAAALKRGGAPNWELGDIVRYNSATHTAVVRTHTGRPLEDVPQIKFSANQYEHLKVGTTVVISDDLGFPVIIGSLDLSSPPQENLIAPTLTGIKGVGADSGHQPVQGGNNYRTPGAPTDMAAGDWAHVGSLGQHVAVLEGGITQIGSPTALLRSIGLAGLLQFITRQTQTVTDFGEWKVQNEDGLTSFILRAGTNQVTQTGYGEGHWTIQIDLGATGDIFNFLITEPHGKVLFKMHVGSDGRLELYGDGGIDLSSGKGGNAETVQDIAGIRVTNVGDDDALAVIGDRKVTVGKAYEENIATDRTSAVGNSEAKFVNKDQTVNVGGTKTDIIAGGAAQDAKSGAVAFTTKVINGGWVIDIGNPKDGANVSAQAGFNLKTTMGDVSLEAGMNMALKAKQAFNAEAGTAMSLKAKTEVSLEAQVVKSNGDSFSALKTEDFLKDLADLFDQLTQFASLPTSGGAPGAPHTLPGIIAWAAKAKAFAVLCKTKPVYGSIKAKHG